MRNSLNLTLALSYVEFGCCKFMKLVNITDFARFNAIKSSCRSVKSRVFELFKGSVMAGFCGILSPVAGAG